MTQVTHTPGPWAVEPLVATQGADMAIVAPSTGFVVAVVQHDPDIQTNDELDGDSVVWRPDELANARLIAAAPAMLAAIRAAIPWIKRTGIADNDPPEYLALVAILSTIDGE